MKKYIFRICIAALGMLAPMLITTAAHAASMTWSGAGSDGNTSTAANWVGGVAPSNGDTLIFPAGTPRSSVVNDSLTTVGGIQLPSTSGSVDTIDISGPFSMNGNIDVDSKRTLDLPDVTLAANLVMTLEYSITGTTVNGVGSVHFVNSTLNLNGHDMNVRMKGYTALQAADLPLSYNVYVPTLNFIGTAQLVGAAGTSIYLNGTHLTMHVSNPSLASAITANDATVEVETAAGLGTSSLSLNNGQLSIVDTTLTTKKTIANAITFNGNLYGATNDANFAIGQQGVDLVGNFDVDFSGTVVLQKDLLIKASATSNARTVTFSGPISGSGIPSLDTFEGDYHVAITSTSNTTSVPAGSYKSVDGAQTLTDSSPSENIIVPWGTLVVNGSRGNVILSTGAVLKGSGTVGDLLVQGTAALKPGASPGCINTGNLTLAGTYEAELGGLTVCTQYDQTNVTGTVNLTGGTLSVVRYDNMVPRLNNSFTIIKNDGSDAVTGTFTGLAQGATVTADGITYTVSYTGGDGNDVVLTVTGVSSSLGAPNTGFAQLVRSGAILPIFATLSGVSVLAVQFVTRRKR